MIGVRAFSVGAQGDWLCGFAEYMGACSPVKAELKAVIRELRLA